MGTLVLAQATRWPLENVGLDSPPNPGATLVLDHGARKAVEYLGRSLLAAGFSRCRPISTKETSWHCATAEELEFARGLTNYSSDDIRRIRGLKTNEIAGVARPLPPRRDNPQE